MIIGKIRVSEFIYNCSKFVAKMSTITDKIYISKIASFIPKLSSKLHKGQCGRIGVIGGSLEYTGAPYFSAITALKVGADLVHVFCCKQAGPVIKSYSPELIVHPLLDEENALEKISPWLERLHALIIGPGLGRESETLRTVSLLLKHCKEEKRYIPLVIDADGLFLLSTNLDLVKDYKAPVILTPNIVELNNLCSRFSDNIAGYEALATSLNVILVQKGEVDIIYNGMNVELLKLDRKIGVLKCQYNGSNRRCGGQGDLLSGAMAVFLTWAVQSVPVDFNVLEIINEPLEKKVNFWTSNYFNYSLAAYAACCLTKECSRLGFSKNGRSMTTSDMIQEIHVAFENIFGS